MIFVYTKKNNKTILYTRKCIKIFKKNLIK